MGRKLATMSAIIALASSADASHLRAVSAFQPTAHENAIEITPVTFLVFGEALLPGEEVNYTSRPYLLPVEGMEPRNHNAAALAGIVVKTELNRDFGHGGLFGDTLRVIVDASAQRSVSEHSAQEVLDATIRATLCNAAKSCRGNRPRPAWIDLLIVGSNPDERRVVGCDELVAELPN